jgi:hypothetical protein
MAKLLPALLLTFAAVLVVGCSSDSGDDRRYPEICDKIIECEATSKDNCIAVYGPLIFSEDCLSAVNSASCEEHLESPAPYLDICFPPCMGTEATCLGDEITVCSQGRTKTSLCVEVCKMSGKDYTGVCADQYGEEMSPTGLEMCWCE